MVQTPFPLLTYAAATWAVLALNVSSAAAFSTLHRPSVSEIQDSETSPPVPVHVEVESLDKTYLLAREANPGPDGIPIVRDPGVIRVDRVDHQADHALAEEQHQRNPLNRGGVIPPPPPRSNPFLYTGDAASWGDQRHYGRDVVDDGDLVQLDSESDSGSDSELVGFNSDSDSSDFDLASDENLYPLAGILHHGLGQVDDDDEKSKSKHVTFDLPDEEFTSPASIFAVSGTKGDVASCTRKKAHLHTQRRWSVTYSGDSALNGKKCGQSVKSALKWKIRCKPITDWTCVQSGKEGDDQVTIGFHSSTGCRDKAVHDAVRKGTKGRVDVWCKHE